MSGVPKIPNLKSNKIELKNELDKIVFLREIQKALKDFIKQNEKVNENEIFCESFLKCSLTKKATPVDIRYFRTYNKKEDVYTNSFIAEINNNLYLIYYKIIYSLVNDEKLRLEYSIYKIEKMS